jgi:hypothetical protein
MAGFKDSNGVDWLYIFAGRGATETLFATPDPASARIYTPLPGDTNPVNISRVGSTSAAEGATNAQIEAIARLNTQNVALVVTGSSTGSGALLVLAVLAFLLLSDKKGR